MLRYYARGPSLAFDRPRNPGRLGKLAVAAAAAGSGRPMPPKLCDRRDRQTGVHNADRSAGFDLCVGEAMKDVAEVWGRSLNLPVLELARNIDETALDRATAAFGATYPSTMAKSDALTLGRISISPRDMLGAMLALQRGVAGQSAVAPQPHLITGVAPGRPAVDLRFAFTTPAARSFMTEIAQAALTHARGTIRTSAALPLRRHEIGKTGTVDGPDGRAVAKWVAGADDGGAYIGIIAAPSGILGGDLQFRLLNQMLRSEMARAAGAKPPS